MTRVNPVNPRVAMMAVMAPVFALGFRPFYLLAAVFATVAVPLWVAFPALGIAWHAHEMVFGFAAAVITGFLFTAARNWTGLETPSGALLAALVVLWLLGRGLMLTGPTLPAAVVDSLFLPAVAAALWGPLHRARDRNRFFVAILLGFAAFNVAFHLGIGAPIAMIEGALAMVVLIVTIMGGRVIPAFTRNALPAASVRQVAWLDHVAIGSVTLALGAYLVGVPGLVMTILALAAALANGARLLLWDPLATRHAPILWILHLSYAWIVIGCVLLATHTATLAIHAFGTGAIGGMVIGMMTRTARGHTGRPLRASPPEVTAYVLVHLAAATRVFVPLAASDIYVSALAASATLWSAAFAIYAVVYAPILMRPRIDGKPG